MPGVLLIEAMAQTSGWIILALSRFERMPFLAGVKEAKFRNFVMPGTGLHADGKDACMKAPATRKTQAQVLRR